MDINELALKLKPLFESLFEDAKNQLLKQSKWVNRSTALALLGITSDTTLQKYRDADLIRYTKYGKTILYCRESIEEFHEKNANYGAKNS